MAEINMCVAGKAPEPNALLCQLPAEDPVAAEEVLRAMFEGGAAGSGQGMARLGVDMPRLRAEYERELQQLIARVEEMKRSRMPAREIARFAVRERRHIATRIRLRQGPLPLIGFEIRDWAKYGVGGRTFGNMERRAGQQGFKGPAADAKLTRGATTPNVEITESMVRGAKYLKQGGRVILVIGISATAYRLLTASEDELERVLYEEAGGWIGGGLGSGAGVGLCLVFGIASGGWGLLACGIVGGLAGGAGGAYAGGKLYYSQNRSVEHTVSGRDAMSTGELLERVPELDER
jgi:hypothetical protein